MCYREDTLRLGNPGLIYGADNKHDQIVMEGDILFPWTLYTSVPERDTICCMDEMLFKR